jgi:hypothetical protein
VCINVSGNYGTSFVDMHHCAAIQSGIALASTQVLRNGVDFYDVVTPNTYTGCATALNINTGASGAIFKGLYVLGSGGNSMAFSLSSSCLIESCVFCNSSSAVLAFISNGGFNKFNNCIFNYGSYCLQSGTTNGGGNLIKNCTFRNAGLAGVYSIGAANSNTLQGCTFVSCVQNVLSGVASQGNVAIGCNLGADTGTPYYLSGVANLTLINCTNAGASATVWAPSGTVVAYQNNTDTGSTYYTAVTELSNSSYKTASGDEFATHSPAATGTSTGGVFIASPNAGLANSRNINNKGLYSLGKVNCTANKLVTVKAWLRSYAGSGGDLCQLAVLGGSIDGVPTNVASKPTSNSLWSQHTISFTPTESAVVEVYVQYWGSAGGFYADGMAVTIAS